MTSFKVIGVGLGRTGTTSLRQALQDLGYSPCHHWDATLEEPKHINRLWKEVYHSTFRNGCDNESYLDDMLKEIFKGYVATVDNPGYMFYEKFMEWNPDAKVILTVRDSPEEFAKSTMEAFFPEKKDPWLQRKFWEMIRNLGSPEHFYWMIEYLKEFHGQDMSQPNLESFTLRYTDWVKKIMNTVPPEKLLVYNVKEGWDPLCKFLGMDVPDHPFPRKNNRLEKNEADRELFVNSTMKKVGKIIAFVLVIAVAIFFGRLLY